MLASRRRNRLIPRRWLFPLCGSVVAALAPIGLALTRAIVARRRPGKEFLEDSVESDPVPYLYVGVMGALVMVFAGWRVGRAHDELTRLAARDSLTGLVNRREVERLLAAEAAFARRQEIPASLLMLDIDGFKRINDSAGHIVGDRVLVQVGQAIQSVVRTDDVVGRVGGDEMVVILRGATREQAVRVAEHVRDAVSGVTVFGRPVTVSIGVADLEACPGGDEEDWMRAADRALYGAKNGGRDRVVVALPAPPP